MQSRENWICEVERLLEHIYPDRWSLSEFPTDEYPYHYYLHFPIIEISNSQNLKHTIKDLYVRFQFNSIGILGDIDGTRATYNQAEFESLYSHSHLSSSAAKDATWGGFCFGSESINNDIGTLQEEFHSIIFEALLFELETFLSWESLEGGPYRKIENISRRATMSTPTTEAKEDSYKRFVAKHTNINFTVSINPPKISIDPFDEDFMDNVLPLIDSVYRVLRDSSTGEFFIDGSSTTYESRSLNFEFKGDLVYQIIESSENEEERKRYPHPDILKWISERLERKLTLHALAKRESNAGNANSCIIAGVMVESI